VRGTASLDGFLRDTFRHYLQNPAMFIGLTISVYHRHPESEVVIAGLLGTVLSTRIVGDLEDRVTLQGLIKRLKQNAPVGVLPAPSPPSRGILYLLRSKFLPDVAVMTWLSIATIVDATWLRSTNSPWLALDIMLIVLAAAQIILKTGGLLLLWRRGVSGRVESIVAEIKAKQHERM
jgi:hypothetical protein